MCSLSSNPIIYTSISTYRTFLHCWHCTCQCIQSLADKNKILCFSLFIDFSWESNLLASWWNEYCLRGKFYCIGFVWAIYLSGRHKSTFFGSNGYWFGNNSNKYTSLRSRKGFANLAVVQHYTLPKPLSSESTLPTQFIVHVLGKGEKLKSFT